MDFDIKEATILLTLAGSHCYGLQTVGSDIDCKGIAIPPKKYYFGCLNKFEQAVAAEDIAAFINLFSLQEVISNTKLEGAVYEITKFAKLTLDCNPNMLDLLFCRDEDIRLITSIGQLLRDNRNKFISSKCKFTFTGYAVSQLKRIMTHRKWLLDPPKAPPIRADFGLHDDEETIPKDQFMAAQAAITRKLDSWEIDYGALSEPEVIFIQSQLTKYLSELLCSIDDKWRNAAKLVGYDDNLIYMLEKERKYRTAKDQWEQFKKWEVNRNKARAELEMKHGYDTKHAAHLYRLLAMCEEILTTGQVNIHRGGIDREEILAIRNGAWKLDTLIDWADKKQQYLDNLYLSKKYVVPKAPDHNAVNEIIINSIEKFLFRS